MLHFTINFMAILCSASDLAIGGHLDFLFLYPIAVRPMDRGRTGASFVARFRLRLGVETPEGDEAGRFAADEAFLAL